MISAGIRIQKPVGRFADAKRYFLFLILSCFFSLIAMGFAACAGGLDLLFFNGGLS